MTEFDKPSLWQRVAPLLRGFDFWLLLFVGMLASAGLVAMYSSGFDHGTRFTDHGRNMLIAAAILFVVAQIPPQQLMKVAVPLYMLGVALLVAVALFGITKKGAQRWVNVGVVIQPSELLKIATPLMLAWWFQRREGQLRGTDFVIAMVLLLVPVGLIMKQPDLGTSLLVMAAGLSVIFFAACPGNSSCRPCSPAPSASPLSCCTSPSCAPTACAGPCCMNTSRPVSVPCWTPRAIRWARDSTSSRG